ncbi:glycosyltransferase 28 domain-containing protein [Niallia circulans]|uniref:PssE/Cps14G family polysaccharide biosynthesis glycosyltransferase n=1 Tax=Niallia TaxID=2837506 RepID=UPI00077CA4EC|nr:PssE/Cps14G family polysaccharide biosynthesis glycosyltransferase [Niallia circulans]MDR4317677.1 glycosyltransferase family 28 [Niallia circulans]MED3841189.1 PssE/Cps14G family polysaccharide biosynthesis glycosyltransferase [Niallia circulans]MED4245766.1 PssE/Cps14G family polysaccharide biosynthesis glycosyltransferase [Niallia circulans]MED4247652.1 PssE/Cps14G family polysaccharide biosynthesis glycosyltransferase [Niallia circulans]QKH63346.1 glycosyltransferase family 28 [Niallia 
MIFVILGTQKFPMNRLIDEIDLLIERNVFAAEEVVIQSGYSKTSKFAKSFEIIKENDFDQYLANSSLVICHGGTSAIIKSLNLSKKVIVVPRLSKFNEHVDDHQKEIVNVLFQKGYIEMVEDIKELEHYVTKAYKTTYNKYNSNGELANVIVNYILNETE